MQTSYINPMVIEEEQGTRYSSDIFTRMLKDRQIFVVGEVNQDMAISVVSQMLYLDALNHNDITLVLSSPGGSCLDGMSIVDTMYSIQSKTNIMCFGLAASMGSVILAAGTGKRTLLPHAQVMIHNPSTGMQGQFYDLENNFEHLKRTRETLFKVYTNKTKIDRKTLEEKLTKDWWLTPQEAVDWGVADEIMNPVHSW